MSFKKIGYYFELFRNSTHTHTHTHTNIHTHTHTHTHTHIYIYIYMLVAAVIKDSEKLVSDSNSLNNF